jgi:hypothetical protein|tara:strand:+ start:2464 stop:3270 length:807 start_codon:yes stop_codon:yes gene_type:complete
VNVVEWQDRYGPWALVTGASSGIGAEFCRQLAAKGLNIILVARREDRLSQVAAEIEHNYAVETLTVVQDLAAGDATARVLSNVGERQIGVLVNNAGFGLVGRFHELDRHRHSEMVRLNCIVPVEITQAYLPQMVSLGRGAIIFLASTAAYQATPYFSLYGATKVFNRFLGEALWEEYRASGIDVMALSPGYTDTEFQKVAGMGDRSYGVGSVTSEEVVSTALNALGRVPSVIHGRQNRFLAFVQRFLPRRVILKTTGFIMRKMERTRK